MSRHQLNALYVKKTILGFFKTFKTPFLNVLKKPNIGFF
jgi:hypothetical protein